MFPSFSSWIFIILLLSLIFTIKIIKEIKSIIIQKSLRIKFISLKLRTNMTKKKRLEGKTALFPFIICKLNFANSPSHCVLFQFDP